MQNKLYTKKYGTTYLSLSDNQVTDVISERNNAQRMYAKNLKLRAKKMRRFFMLKLKKEKKNFDTTRPVFRKVI